MDPSGNVYTANWKSRNVTKIKPSGTSKILGRTGRRPVGIAVDPYGNVYTTNNGDNTVSRIVPRGASEVIARTGRRPIGITSDAAGFLYTANLLSNDVTEVFPVVQGRQRPIVEHGHRACALQPERLDHPVLERRLQEQGVLQAALPAVLEAVEKNADPAVQAVSATSCMGIGRVPYTYRIAETELTVAQWVNFLNRVDPGGRNRHRLWDAAQSSRCGRSTGRSTETSGHRRDSATTWPTPVG